MSRFNPTSADWREACVQLEKRLELCREQLEYERQNHDETQVLRGRIAELKYLLAWQGEEDMALRRKDVKLMPPKYT